MQCDGHSSGANIAELPRRDRPGRRCGNGPSAHGLNHPNGRPYLVLLPVGFALPLPLPAARCALTAPFHPYRPCTEVRRRFAFCGTFPGVAPAGCYPAPCFRGARTFLHRSRKPFRQQPSGHLAHLQVWASEGGRSSLRGSNDFGYCGDAPCSIVIQDPIHLLLAIAALECGDYIVQSSGGVKDIGSQLW